MNRALLVDDHAVYREAFGLVLEQRLDVRVAAQVASIDEARPCASDARLGHIERSVWPDRKPTRIVQPGHDPRIRCCSETSRGDRKQADSNQ